MNQMRLISTKTHGIIDYIVGVALLVAPDIFGFADADSAVVYVPRILGLMTILLALITDYELSIVNLVPFPIHLIVDALGGLLLLLVGIGSLLAGNSVNEWLPHLMISVGEMLVVMMSQTHRTGQMTMRPQS
jgi:hypothetical protein